MSLLAPSIAVAFLGTLAFVAWLLWLRRTDERRHFVAELAKAAAQFRVQAEEHGALMKRLEDRLRKVEMKTGFSGG